MFEQIIQEFKDNADQEQALPMARYMQNRFPFLGLKRPVRSKIQAQFLRGARKLPEINWEFVIRCWDLPEREYQYLAVDYLNACAGLLRKEDMPRLAFLITNKSWWDTVDLIAARLVGGMCRSYPEFKHDYILNWASGDNIWLARTAILFQLKYKENTDKELLNKIILLNNNSREFFINKAIGWILREYSKTDKEWVKSFINNNPLQPLSVREGSKYL